MSHFIFTFLIKLTNIINLMSERNILKVVMQNAYTDDIYDKQLNGRYTTLNKVMDEMSKYYNLAENVAISIYDKDLYCYVYCGTYPFDKQIYLEESEKVLII